MFLWWNRKMGRGGGANTWLQSKRANVQSLWIRVKSKQQMILLWCHTSVKTYNPREDQQGPISRPARTSLLEILTLDTCLSMPEAFLEVSSLKTTMPPEDLITRSMPNIFLKASSLEACQMPSWTLITRSMPNALLKASSLEAYQLLCWRPHH